MIILEISLFFAALQALIMFNDFPLDEIKIKSLGDKYRNTFYELYTDYGFLEIATSVYKECTTRASVEEEDDDSEMISEYFCIATIYRP